MNTNWQMKSNNLSFYFFLQMDGNPWQVDSLQDFLYLKCPECTFDTQEDLSFQDHALQNHPLSSVFFGKTFVKEENYNLDEDYSEDYKDPLTTSSENLALVPIFPKLSNIKEELIDDTSEFKEEIEKHVNPKRPKPHGCSKCDKSFTTPKRLKKHFEIVHEGKKPIFPKLSSIKKELIDSTSKFDEFGELKTEIPKPYVCSKCNRSYTTSKILRQHFRKVHEGKKLEIKKEKIKQEPNEGDESNNEEMKKCEYCDYTSTKFFSVIKHERKTHPESVHKPFKCSKCDYYCVEKNEFRKHDREVHNAEKVQCPKCDKKIAPFNLRKHIKRMHDKIFPFLCITCGYKATSNSVLKNHIETVHEGKKSLQCNVCAAMFSVKRALNLHIITVHEGLKLYKCPECEKSFGLKCNLTTHIRTVHEGKKAFQCDLCSLKFSQKGSLIGHVASVHEGIKPYECSFCDKRFGVKGTLNTHIKLSHEKKKRYKKSSNNVVAVHEYD